VLGAREAGALFDLAAGVLGTWLLGLALVLLPAQRAAFISPAITTRSD
jgi:hypothetical protein